MGKKNKNNKSQPNAPELQQILLESHPSRQPPRNPYYPDLGVDPYIVQNPPPPAYSDLSRATASQSFAMSQPIQYPRERPTNVIVHQPSIISHDLRAERHHRRVRKFNNEIILCSIFVICIAIWAHSLYEQRPCLNDMVIHKPNKELQINVRTIREMHFHVAYLSVLVLIIALAKSSAGESKSYSCYLLLMNMATLIGTIYTGYLAYLAFFSPCTLKPGEIAAGAVKTLFGSVLDSLPSPDKGVFGESNVVQLMKEDSNGFFIFILDSINCLFYATVFIQGITLC